MFEELATALPAMVFLIVIIGAAFGIVILREWQRSRKHELMLRERQLRIEEERQREEEEHRKAEVEFRKEEQRQAEWSRYETTQREQEREIRQSAGIGTGGFIVLDLPEAQRPLFHDLLKGFEDYASLKGYGVTFSIDSSFDNRIAFKFNLKDGALSVGQARVREDFKEYLNNLKDSDFIDDLPVIVSMEEHQLLVTRLKNRLNFLQYNYNLSKNAVTFYEGLLRKTANMPVLPTQQIVLQNGGSMDSRSFSAINSSKLIQGDRNILEDRSVDTSIRIGSSFNELGEQIGSLDRLIEALRSSQDAQAAAAPLKSAERIKDELKEERSPDQSKIARWLNSIKESLQFGSLGKEVLDAGREVLEKFGFLS